MLQSQPPIQLHTRKGTRIYLTHSKLKSGEAEIWLTNQLNTIAKVYHPQNRTRERENKLKAMLNLQLPSGAFARIVWPDEVLYDNRQQFMGYLMPEIRDAHSWRRISVPQGRKQYGLSLNLKQRMQLCLHLSQLLVQAHSNGIVFGDLKPENILVNVNRLEVFLIDTDSCQLHYNQEFWRCPVGTPAYTPPELQTVRFEEIDQLPSHDTFRLAVLCFELLMGHHPFQGKNRDEKAPNTTQAENISHREWVWKRGGKLVPGPNYPPSKLLSTDLIEKFRQAFELPPGQRPTSADIAELFQIEISQMKPCSHNPEHWYSGHSNNCYWCYPDLLGPKLPAPASPSFNHPYTDKKYPQPSPFTFKPKQNKFPLKFTLALFDALQENVGILRDKFEEQVELRPWATWSSLFTLTLPIFLFAVRWLLAPTNSEWLDLYFGATEPVLQQQFTIYQGFDTCVKFLSSWTQWIPSSYWWGIVITGLVLSALSEGLIGGIMLIAAFIIGLVHVLLALLVSLIWWLTIHFASLLGFLGIHIFLFGDRLIHQWLQHHAHFPFQTQLLNSPALCWMIATVSLLPILMPIAWGIGYYKDEY